MVWTQLLHFFTGSRGFCDGRLGSGMPRNWTCRAVPEEGICHMHCLGPLFLNPLGIRNPAEHLVHGFKFTLQSSLAWSKICDSPADHSRWHDKRNDYMVRSRYLAGPLS